MARKTQANGRPDASPDPAAPGRRGRPALPVRRSPRGRPVRGAVALALGAALLASLGCHSDLVTPITEPPDSDPRNESELAFLRQRAGAPALTTTDTSFVATRGQGLEIEIDYAPEGGETDGEEFLEFELDDESLLRYPAGHPRAGQLFQDGDTVTIRLRIDPTLLIVTLEPSGLEFDPQEPAELEIRYGNADDDYDDDGTPDPPESEERIDLWRQEAVGAPWFRVGEIKDRELDRVRARLTSFSRYALAI